MFVYFGRNKLCCLQITLHALRLLTKNMLIRSWLRSDWDGRSFPFVSADPAFVKRMTRPLQAHHEGALLWEDAFTYFARFKIIFHFFAVWSELRSVIFWIQDGRWIPLLRSWVRLFQWFFELSSRGDRIVMSEILFDIYRHHCFFFFQTLLSCWWIL